MILPQLNPVAASHGDSSDGARLWKRVRRLETDLGYSNLACEVLPNRQTTPGSGRPHWLADESDPLVPVGGGHRKRRLPCVGPSTRFQSSARNRQFEDDRSIPTLARPRGEKSVPFTNTGPLTQRANVLRGVLPRVSAPQNDSDRYRVLPEQPPHDSITMGCSAKLSDGVWPAASAGTVQCTLAAEQSPHTARDEMDKQPEPADLLSSVVSASACNHEASSRPFQTGKKTGEGIDMRAGEDSVGTNGKSTARLSAHGNGQRGRTDAATTVGVARRVLVLGVPPSRTKVSTVRPGTRGSLVSPTNPLTSNTVVARVRQGLQNGEKGHKVLLVGSGTFNPVHNLHIRSFYLARNFLESQKGMRVVGGIVSPSHPTLVRQRHRVRAAEIIPPRHRLSMARAAVGEGSWLAVDPWEATRKRLLDYMSVLEHAKEVCHQTFPGHAGDISILYMCQASKIHHLNPVMLRAGGFGVIIVCRPLEKERLLKELSPSFRHIAIVVEDTAILSAELEKTSSAMVRHLLKQGKSVEGMVGKAVAQYIRDHDIAQRVSGRHRWTVEDNAFMFDREDKKDRPYHNLPRVYVRRPSQMPLHY